MATAKRRRNLTAYQTDFPVPLALVLNAFIDPADRAGGDKWSIHDAPGGIVVLSRIRRTQTDFDENGDPV